MRLTFSLSPGNAHDAVEGRKLLSDWQNPPQNIPLVMDRAYEGDETRQLALDLGFEPVVPPKSNRLNPWQFNKQIYKRLELNEKLFHELKGFRRIFSLKNSISWLSPLSSSPAWMKNSISANAQVRESCGIRRTYR